MLPLSCWYRQDEGGHCQNRNHGPVLIEENVMLNKNDKSFNVSALKRKKELKGCCNAVSFEWPCGVSEKKDGSRTRHA